MQQTKLQSLVEACINTFIGFWVSWLGWPVAAWLFNKPFSNGEHWGFVFFFTVLSVVRGYAIRRWCERYLKQLSARITLWLKS
jgi:hypothetical protein